MAGVHTWSTTAAQNDDASPDGWPEGMNPGGVNDSGREMMAAVATWYAEAQWLIHDATPTYVGATQFSVAGDQTAKFTAGRRIRAIVTAGTIYGTISTSAFTSTTTVTVSWDSTQLDSGLSQVAVHITTPGNVSQVGTANIADNAVSLAKIADHTGSVAGALVYGASGAPEQANAGSAGKILTSKGSGTAPSFESPSLSSGATESAAGIVELATEAELEAATDTERVGTVASMVHHPGVAKAWGQVTISGGTATLVNSFNVTSITRNSTGRYTITLTTAMASANYAVMALSLWTANNGNPWRPSIEEGSKTSTAFDLQFGDVNATLADPKGFDFVVFGAR